jgi:hypothetical protein
MIRETCIGVALLLLAACASGPPAEPRVLTKEVKAAVPVSCVPKDFPSAPAYTDTADALKAAPDAAGRYQLLAANHPARVTREAILEVVVDGCRKAAP